MSLLSAATASQDIYKQSTAEITVHNSVFLVFFSYFSPVTVIPVSDSVSGLTPQLSLEKKKKIPAVRTDALILLLLQLIKPNRHWNLISHFSLLGTLSFGLRVPT